MSLHLHVRKTKIRSLDFFIYRYLLNISLFDFQKVFQLFIHYTQYMTELCTMFALSLCCLCSSLHIFMFLSGPTNKATLDPKLVFPFTRKLFRMKEPSQEPEDTSNAIAMKVCRFLFLLCLCSTSCLLDCNTLNYLE